MANPNVLGVVCILQMDERCSFWIKGTNLAVGHRVVVTSGANRWEGTITFKSPRTMGAKASVNLTARSAVASTPGDLIEITITITNDTTGETGSLVGASGVIDILDVVMRETLAMSDLADVTVTVTNNPGGGSGKSGSPGIV